MFDGTNGDDEAARDGNGYAGGAEKGKHHGGADIDTRRGPLPGDETSAGGLSAVASPARAVRDPPGQDVYEEEVELLDYVEVLVHRRWVVFWGTVVCALLAGIVTSRGPVTYTAQAILLPAQRPDYASLGPDVAVKGRRSADLHASMLVSTPVLRAVLEQRFVYALDGVPVTSTLTEYFGAKTWQETVAALKGAVDVDVDKTGSLTVAASLASAGLAAAVPNALVREMISTDHQRRSRYVREQVAFIEHRVAEVQEELAAAEQALAEFRRSNRDLALTKSSQAFLNPELVVEHSRRQRQVDIRSSLLSTLLNQLEVARLEAKKEFPEVEVLAWAEAPDQAQPRALTKRVLLGGIVGLMASVMLAFLLEYGKRHAETGRLEPILVDLRTDAERLRRLLHAGLPASRPHR